MNIWPFLITRNKSLGYQLVVAPDFLVKAKMTGVLLYVTEGSLSEESEIYSRQVIDDQNDKTMTIVYRVTNATDDNGKLLLDGFGRSINQTIGFVQPEQITSSTIPMSILEQVFHTLQEPMQQFWEEDTEFSPVMASAMEWPTNTATTPYYKLIRLDSYRVNESKVNNQSDSQAKGKVENSSDYSTDFDDPQQNLLLRLFKLLWNWLTK